MGRGLAAMAAVLTLLAVSAWAQVLDSIVARVDTEVITWSGVLQERMIRRLTGEGGEVLAPEAVRDALVERRLLIAEAAKLRLTVDVGEARREVEALVQKAGDEFWEQAARLGLGVDDLQEWAARRQLARQFLELRRELTFISESEVRNDYYAHPERFGERSLVEVRDEIRSRLVEEQYREELRQWVEQQESEGRVTRLPLPGGI